MEPANGLLKMILICPNCGQRSRVDGAQAQASLAQVQCGGCGKLFYASAAYREQETGKNQSVSAQIARARARRGKVIGPKALVWHRLKPVLALALPVGLLVLSLWDLNRLSAATVQDVTAQVYVAQGQKDGLGLENVHAAPYAPTGGPDGLLVVGRVVNRGPAPLTWTPYVAIDAKSGASHVTALTIAGVNQTLPLASGLEPLSTDAPRPAPAVLGPNAAVPFVVQLPLPQAPQGRLWTVTVSM